MFERLHARVLNASKDASSVYILSDIAYELIYQVGEHPSCTAGEMGETESRKEIIPRSHGKRQRSKPGTELRAIRQELGLTFRDVHAASLALREKTANPLL